jgi:ABC-type spermidine/putrescine transport system permease subunit II
MREQPHVSRGSGSVLAERDRALAAKSGIVSLIVNLIVMLLAAILGVLLGVTYRRHGDRETVEVR